MSIKNFIIKVSIGISFLVVSHISFADKDNNNGKTKAYANQQDLIQEVTDRQASDAVLQNQIDLLQNQIDMLTRIPTYKIGDTLEGDPTAIVFYVDGSGQHGLVAKNLDEDGFYNWNEAMIAAESHGCVSVDGYAENCWHLPTKSDLRLLFEAKNLVGGFSNTAEVYWSSSLDDIGEAWFKNFYAGSENIYPTTNTCKVRAIRAF